MVHRRAEIVDCLEMDRRRQEEEDHSIQQHLDVFNSRGAAGTEEPTPPKTKSKGLKMIKSPINLMKKDKTKKKKKPSKDDDVDKDVDEAENSTTATTTSKPPNVKPEKDKKSKWFKS